MFLGLDLGTSGLKGIVINDRQEVLAEASAPPVSEPGWGAADNQQGASLWR
jgi:xylulokinase